MSLFGGYTDYDSSSRRRRIEEEEEMRELDEYKEKIQSIGTRTKMDKQEFLDLFPMMLDSDDSVVTDAFEQLLLVGKLIFGSELGELAAERARKFRAEVAARAARIAKQTIRNQKQDYIDRISAKIIERRFKLLERLMHNKTQYPSLKGKEKIDVDELIESKHIKKGLFGSLKVKSISKIPTSKLATSRRETVTDTDNSSYYGWGMF